MINISKLYRKILRFGVGSRTTKPNSVGYKSQTSNRKNNIPWTPLTKPVSTARFAIVSTAGIHLKSQHPFTIDEKGDPGYREIYSADMSNENSLVKACRGQLSTVQGIGTLFPVAYLNELAKTENIGFANYRHFSFYGHVKGKKIGELIHESLPKVINKLKADQVDIVILTSNCKHCDHIMRKVQRTLETVGLVTISITKIKSAEQSIDIPRALYVKDILDKSSKNIFEKRALLRSIFDEVLRHLAVTERPGLQSGIERLLGHDSKKTNKDDSNTKSKRLKDSVYDPFSHANNKSEDFAWTAFVEFY